MDPFLRKGQPTGIFRAVPMTHILSPSTTSQGMASIEKPSTATSLLTASIPHDASALQCVHVPIISDDEHTTLQKWRKFGITSIPSAPAARLPHSRAAPQPPAPTLTRHHASERTFLIVSDSDEGEQLPPKCPMQTSTFDERTPNNSTAPLHSSDAVESAAASDAQRPSQTALFQQELANLSMKVRDNIELQRCGPPKRTDGGKSQYPKRNTTRSKKKRVNDANNDGGNGDDDEGVSVTKSGESAGRMKPKESEQKSKKPRTRSSPNGQNGEPKNSSTGKRARQGPPVPTLTSSTAVNGDISNSSARRTLFSLTAPRAASNSDTGEARAAAEPTVTVPFYLLSNTDTLYQDIESTLNDPDRIQAPPLFVGFSVNSNSAASPTDGQTNFCTATGLKNSKARVHSCFTISDPRRCHECVDLIVVRWKENLYGLPAQAVGFAFLKAVLVDLPGVEVITFHAQSLLVALLSFCEGTLWSHWVSDVRVMAWMAQLHISTGTGPEGGAASESEMSSLYDYHQLHKLVCSGRGCPVTQLCVTGSADGETAVSLVHQMLCRNVYSLATVYRTLYGLLGSRGLLQPFLRQEKRIALLLALIKYNGIVVDLQEVHRYQSACFKEMQKQRSRASELVPNLDEEFNIQSHDQCRRVIYEVLGLGRHLIANVGESCDGSGDANSAVGGLAITKGGKLSTAEEILRALAKHHEFPQCLLHYRRAAKLLQTYVEGMMSLAVVRPSSVVGVCDSGTSTDENNLFTDTEFHASHGSLEIRQPEPLLCCDETGESHLVNGSTTLPASGYATLHPNFLQEGTITGRLSCVEPNLQNLPRGSVTAHAKTSMLAEAAADGDKGSVEEPEAEDTMAFRRCFVAPPEYLLLSVDYQQIELRVLAHLCGDAALIDALTNSVDIHRTIAEVVFRKRPVSEEERSLAKRVVFGVLYGAGPRTLAVQMNVTVERAIHITSLLTSAFPRIDHYHRKVMDESREAGAIRTISGRLRYLPDINSSVLTRRSYAERQAFNSIVQGSAADIMKMAMIGVERDVLRVFQRTEISLLSQIHDELIFLVQKDRLAAVVPLVTQAMTKAVSLLVPLCVTVKFGPSLSELTEWSVEHELGLLPPTD